MLSPKIFHTTYCLAPSLCYLAGLGKEEVPCILPREFRKNTLSRASGDYSQTGLRIAAISHKRFRSWSFQLELLFTEALPQDYNYRFCLVIKRVWIFHQRKRKQLTQKCGVNLSHSLLDRIPVVCMDSGGSMSPCMGSSELMGQESQWSTPPFPLLGKVLELREARKACALMAQFPSSHTSLCSENWLFSFLLSRCMEGCCFGNGKVGRGLRGCLWRDNRILGMPICSQYCFLSISLALILKPGTEFTFFDNPSHHWLWSLSPGPDWPRWCLPWILKGLSISGGYFCALSLVPGAPMALHCPTLHCWSQPGPTQQTWVRSSEKMCYAQKRISWPPTQYTGWCSCWNNACTTSEMSQ